MRHEDQKAEADWAHLDELWLENDARLDQAPEPDRQGRDEVSITLLVIRLMLVVYSLLIWGMLIVLAVMVL